MAARYHIWRIDNLNVLNDSQIQQPIYVPAASWTTGDVDPHELVIQADGSIVLVNTLWAPRKIAICRETGSDKPSPKHESLMGQPREIGIFRGALI
jgi:hypothetical protein